MTLPSSHDLTDIKENNLSITFLGFVDEPLKVGSLVGNRFIITVRDIAKGEIAGTQQKATTLSRDGIPNYFDAQRFGSVIGKEFIAKYLIRKEYENAVKTYLTTYNKSESKRLKDEKRHLLSHWNELLKINAKQQPLRNVVVAYQKTKSFEKAYEAIALPIRKMHLQAYQSHLWNECVKELLKRVVPKTNLYSIEYPVGSLLFYKRISESQLTQIPQKFPLLSSDVALGDTARTVVEKVLAKEGITLSQFGGQKGDIGAYFSSGERSVLVRPQEFNISEAITDELNKNRYKMILRFTLPKGSYATLITKRLFNH
jgi:tRNA pseudouridine13 synthase